MTRRPAGGRDAWRHARELVMAHGWNAVAYQILNPGIDHWFAADGDAVIGFATYARTRVVAGAPVCAAERLVDVTEEFARAARRAGERVLYFGAGERLEPIFAARRDHAFVPLGAQPWWTPSMWEATVRAHPSLRAQLNRARNKRVRVVEWPPAIAHQHPALAGVLATWLAGRGLPPLHFLVEPRTLGLLDDRRVFVAERESADGVEVVAFLVATPIPARHAWLLEQWPRVRRAPNGTVELLVDAAVRALGDDGAQAATMGLSPLSPHAPSDAPVGVPRPPAWLAFVLTWMRAHGRRFYDFAGLDAFKTKFRPGAWEPIYAVGDRPTFGPRELWAIAGVFSSGSPAMLIARALAGAARTELRTARATVVRALGASR